MESGKWTRKESGKREFLSPPPSLFPSPPPSLFPFPIPSFSPLYSAIEPLWMAIMDGNYGWLVNSKHHLLCISPLFNYRLAKE